MATSAFKSNTRRGSARTGGSENSPKKAPFRRSQSVSSLSRASDRRQQFDISSDFLNKRDNPLFCSDVSPPDNQIQTPCPVGLAQFAQNPTKASGSALPSESGSAYAQRERGRPLTRNELAGRSLSGVDRGRRGRSVSRGHYAASEGELERFSVFSSNYRNKSSLNVSTNSLKRANTQRKPSELRAIESSDNSASYLEAPNLGDGISTGSLSEAEEKTISAVCEQMKSSQGDHVGGVDNAASGIYETVRSEVRRAISDIQNDLESAIRRNNDAAIAGTNVADIPPDLVNPGAVELVLDIRREYARKLEESQERATKLRADLAIEEQRGQELSRILKEILPDPKTNNVQKSRPGRKNSSERRKMSKRLTEEAMAYFDECVSISTFDSSDFSAPEDLPLSSTGATTLEHAPACLDHGSPSVSTSCCRSSCLNRKQESSCHGLPMDSHMDSGLTASSGSNKPMINQASLRGNTSEWSQKLQFSLSQTPSENIDLEQLLKNYIENAEEESDKNRINSEDTRLNYYGVDEYLQGCTESLLFDRVLLKNRIDTGSLHLCCGNLAISCSPFGSVI